MEKIYKRENYLNKIRGFYKETNTFINPEKQIEYEEEQEE